MEIIFKCKTFNTFVRTQFDKIFTGCTFKREL